MKDINVILLHRSFRLEDNMLLNKAVELGLPFLILVCINENEFKNIGNKNCKRVQFLSDAVSSFREQISALKHEYLIVYNQFKRIADNIVKIKDFKINSVIVDDAYEPDFIDCYNKIDEQKNIELIRVSDSFLLPLDRCRKDDESAFKVFSPFKKKFLTFVNEIPKLTKLNASKMKKLSLADSDFLQIKKELKSLNILDKSELKSLGFEGSELEEFNLDNLEKLKKELFSKKIKKYDVDRDFMATDGTSKLSPFIRYGVISIREIFYKSYELAKKSKGAEVWMSELIWREFYANIAKEYPESLESEFIEKYRDKIKWKNDKKLFKAWQEGKTGYPIVDAAMRQLLKNGWMHNRARMVVASFLTKNLLIDWRWGEKHFADYLVDYEPASNVGGWQWSASTGVDPQPYFRIFSPFSQAKKFDPECEYIKKYIPELNEIDNKTILSENSIEGYIPHIVDYKKSRKKALSLYKSIK